MTLNFPRNLPPVNFEDIHYPKNNISIVEYHSGGSRSYTNTAYPEEIYIVKIVCTTKREQQTLSELIRRDVLSLIHI